MTTRADYFAGTQRFFDDQQTFETVQSMSPLIFEEDFIGAGHSAGIPAAGSPVAGYPWVKKIVGTAPPTAGFVSNAACGQIQMALTTTSEKEEATVYWNDNLALDATKRLGAEFRAAATVAPSASGVELVFGLAQAWIDGPDNNARYIEFALLANNTLVVRKKDGVATVSQSAALIASPNTAITLDTNPHLFRIDVSDPNDVAFYYDGNRVNAKGSITWGASASNSLLQPYMSVYKPSGTGVATLTVDKVDCWSNRI